MDNERKTAVLKETSDTAPRIVVRPATPDTERLAPPASASDPAIEGTLMVPQQANQPVAVPRVSSSSTDDIYDQYAVLGKIGSGGMGIVYLARDRKLGRHVAIKRLKPSAQNNLALHKRFLQEARAAAVLAHPHIAHVYGLGEDREGPYIVMEYVAGKSDDASGNATFPATPLTLEAFIGRQGALPQADALELTVKLSRAVTYAHAQGVIHRDLKPTNILMDPGGEPKLVDFGLARLMRDEESKLTAPGEKLLSLGYGAPEQESDASVSDERADVYGLGALFYFVITGQNPRYFREEDLPASVRPVICKAMARDREQRWPTAAAFTEAIAALQSHTQIEHPTVKTTWRCKWCDTINPLTTRFCAECGWDGGENCLECGADMHVGVLFCRACGANAREYELVANTIARVEQSMATRQLDAAISFASRTFNLEPCGSQGRQMLSRIRELRELAEKNLGRRDQLKDLIEVEMRAENYERALRFIQELRSLLTDQKIFATEQAQIPGLIVKRDLARVRRAFREKNWTQGTRLLADMRDVDEESLPEFLRLVRQLRGHHRNRTVRRSAVALLLAGLIYLCSLPALGRLLENPPVWLARLYAPAVKAYQGKPTHRLFKRYASLWGGIDFNQWQVPVALSDETDETPVISALPYSDTLARLSAAYRKQLSDIHGEYELSMEDWPADYRRALKAQRDRYRSTGDYSEWHAVDLELTRFERAGGIEPPNDDDPPELHRLKIDYAALLDRNQLTQLRKLVSATKRHVAELETLRSDLTRADQMEEAGRIHREIQRLQSDPAVLADKERLAALETRRVDSDVPTYAGIASDGLEEMSLLRSTYDEGRRKVEEDYSSQLETWPDKYVEALSRLLEERQLAGDFPGWEAANRELDRFELDRTLTDFMEGEDEPHLEQLKLRFSELKKEYALTRARGLVKVAGQYEGKLDALLSNYTKSNKIEAATLVNSELRRMRGDNDLLNAQMLLTEHSESTSP